MRFHSKPRVLFLCVHNSARSQLAEGLLRKMAGDAVEVFSAGSEPSELNPFARRVLEEMGANASEQYSKSVSQFLGQPFDYVLTLCAEEVCPVFPGRATRLHWAMLDPAASQGSDDERLEAFRYTARDLEHRLTELISTLRQRAIV